MVDSGGFIIITSSSRTASVLLLDRDSLRLIPPPTSVQGTPQKSTEEPPRWEFRSSIHCYSCLIIGGSAVFAAQLKASLQILDQPRCQSESPNSHLSPAGGAATPTYLTHHPVASLLPTYLSSCCPPVQQQQQQHRLDYRAAVCW